jgi:hypothetical protein
MGNGGLLHVRNAETMFSMSWNVKGVHKGVHYLKDNGLLHPQNFFSGWVQVDSCTSESFAS